jgi:hypothetical protein
MHKRIFVTFKDKNNANDKVTCTPSSLLLQQEKDYTDVICTIYFKTRNGYGNIVTLLASIS